MARVMSNSFEERVFIDVDVTFSSDGEMIPTAVYSEEGERFEIDRITDVRTSYQSDLGRTSEKYTIWVEGRRSYLFYLPDNSMIAGSSPGRWFAMRTRVL